MLKTEVPVIAACGILWENQPMKSLVRREISPVFNYLLIVVFYLALFFTISLISRNIGGAKAEQVLPARSQAK